MTDKDVGEVVALSEEDIADAYHVPGSELGAPLWPELSAIERSRIVRTCRTLLESEHAAREKAEAERDEALRACKAAFDSINRFPGSLHDRAMTKLEKALKGRNLDWRDPALTAAERDKERLLEALRGVIQVRDKAAFDAARTLIKEMEGNG